MTDEGGRPAPDEPEADEAVVADDAVEADDAVAPAEAGGAAEAGEAAEADEAVEADDAVASVEAGDPAPDETGEAGRAEEVEELEAPVPGEYAEPVPSDAIEAEEPVPGDANEAEGRPVPGAVAWPGDSMTARAEPKVGPGVPAPDPASAHEPGDEAGPGDEFWLEPDPDAKPADPAPEPAEPEPRPEPESMLEPGGRDVRLRLARLHLRIGTLALARAELEASAGGGHLDEPALLDLAEARWRTGDLAGAGEAANAAIGRGVDDPLAYVIAAEAVAGLGRPAEARRLAGRAVKTTGGSLDALFAGMPRSLIWPGEPIPDETVAAETAALAAAAVARGRAAETIGPASAAAAEAFAGGRGALARGDTQTAALRLGVAIRLEPGFAQGVLAAIGDRVTEPALALVAGDALRLLGREHEALAAYDTARGKPRLPGAAGPEPEPPWPDGDAGLD